MTAPRGRFAALLVCFVLSGSSALLYETAWSSLLGAVFGTSQLAVAAVLVATMGGLAAGAAVAARWGSRIRWPVLVSRVAVPDLFMLSSLRS